MQNLSESCPPNPNAINLRLFPSIRKQTSRKKLDNCFLNTNYMCEISYRVQLLKDLIRKSLNSSSICKPRVRKLTFDHLIYTQHLMVTNNYGYETATSHLITNTGVEVSYQAVQKACNNFGYQYIHNITDAILGRFPQSKSQRFIAVDASWLKANKYIYSNATPYLSSNTGSYVMPLLTCLYDINLKVPIKLQLSHDHNERRQFLECIDATRAGDCLIFDRGYPSLDLDVYKRQIVPRCTTCAGTTARRRDGALSDNKRTFCE